MSFELRAYRNSDLALMPPRPCEVGAARLERELAYIGAQRLANPSFTLWGGHFKTEPIGAAGIIIFQPGVGEAWLRGSVRLDAHAVVVARQVKTHFRAIVKQHKLRVVQMMVEQGVTPAPSGLCAAPLSPQARACEVKLRFARWLGFEIEGLMRNRGPNGENFYMMAYHAALVGEPIREVFHQGFKFVPNEEASK